MSPRPKLVVFDCDGVLVDSEALVLSVEAGMFTAAGFPITADEIAQRYTGLSWESMLARMTEDFGRPVPADLAGEIERASLDLIPRELRPVPGVPATLARLGLPRCVASSSDLNRIELSLRVCGLDRFFARGSLFSAEMVRNGKPAPDLFLLAAEKMGTRPEDCIVIEDSPPGVQAARAAGMTAVGLTAGGHARPGLERRLEEAGATSIFATAAELARYLQA